MNFEEESKKTWKFVEKLRKEGKLPPPPTPEEMADEPTALANSGYRERLQREYPPISPEKSDSKPMGALGRRKAEEERKKEEALKEIMKIEIALDPDIEWVVKTVDGKSYLSVKQN